MVQKELGDRLFAVPSTKAYSAVSVLTQLACRREEVRAVPPAAFRPQPRVDSSFVTFVRGGRVCPRDERRRRAAGEAPPLTAAEYAAMDQLVRLAFGQRRKVLTNTLAGAARAGVTLSRDDVRRALAELGLSSGGAPGGACAAAVGGVGTGSGVAHRRRRELWAGMRTASCSGAAMSAGDGRLDAEVMAPAKLNLALLVGPLRPDGFHEIASLMVPVTLADRVVVERTPGAGLDVVCDVAPGEQNLAAKLVRELEARLERTFEVRVTIDKHVPHGGGLGGGSSDAAATLVALERLFDLDLSAASALRRGRGRGLRRALLPLARPAARHGQRPGAQGGRAARAARS